MLTIIILVSNEWKIVTDNWTRQGLNIFYVRILGAYLFSKLSNSSFDQPRTPTSCRWKTPFCWKLYFLTSQFFKFWSYEPLLAVHYQGPKPHFSKIYYAYVWIILQMISVVYAHYTKLQLSTFYGQFYFLASQEVLITNKRVIIYRMYGPLALWR